MSNTDSANRASARLKQRLSQPEILVMMGSHDVLSARIIEKSGFESIVMGGFSAAGSYLGMPDIGLLTFNEALAWLNNICNVTSLPVMADADNGYGGAANVVRTVKAYEQAGAAAVILEDQVWPKRCGHMQGKSVTTKQEMLQKIYAALDARDHILLCARTDAMAVNGFEDALDRAVSYAEAGADIIFFEAVETEEQMMLINEAVPAFTQINIVDHGKTPVLPVPRLQELGYDLVTFPVSLTFAYAKAASGFCDRVMADHGTHNLQTDMMNFKDYTELVGLSQIRDSEAEYLRKIG